MSYCPPSITPDYSCSQINNPIYGRSLGSTPLLITATTLPTAQTIGNLSLTNTSIFDIDVFASVVLQTSSNTIYNMSLIILIDGVQVGQTFISSLSGINHYLTMPIQCSLLNASASTHTILLKGYANHSSIITVNNFQILAIAHLT